MILFLDFDGVLHPDAAYLEKGRGPVLRAEGELFMWAPLLVAALSPYVGVKIVLSTSWVRALGFSRACRYLPPELRERVIGATWHSSMNGLASTFDWDNVTRYQQIARYVASATLEKWIALDDDGEGWAPSASERLVLCDGWQGLSNPDTLTALDAALRRGGARRDIAKSEWWHQMIANMKRMATDEGYRREIAKRIF